MILLEELWDHVRNIHDGCRPDLGPLTTTFLMSMSMPMINVPLERIERQIACGTVEGYVDDRFIDEEAVDAFREVIQRGRLVDAPFFKARAWRFVEYTGRAVNLARGLPDDIAESLAADDAVKRAAMMSASQWISVLRNALAHGGVAYLNEAGRSSYDEPVKMLAFASGKFEAGNCPSDKTRQCRGVRGRLVSLRVLRISEEDFLDFLQRWVAWLSAAGLSKVGAQ